MTILIQIAPTAAHVIATGLTAMLMLAATAVNGFPKQKLTYGHDCHRCDEAQGKSCLRRSENMPNPTNSQTPRSLNASMWSLIKSFSEEAVS